MADVTTTARLNTVPTFDNKLQLSQVEQINFRGQEPWGRWLLGHQAKLLFKSPTQQQVDLNFNISLPYDGQWVKLILNGKLIFSGVRRPTTTGAFNSRLLIELQQGANQLELLTNRSNLDGTEQPFAKNDSTDISIGLNSVAFASPQPQEQILYGPQPSGFMSSAYNSAGPQGLGKLFEQHGPITVDYRLLRRFEKQSFTFELDGKPVYTLSPMRRGNLLVGHFNLPAAKLNSSQVHLLRVSSATPASPSAFLTTAQDGPNVQFYVQQLQIKNAAPQSQNTFLFIGLSVLLLTGLLWFLLFRPQRA